VKVYPLKCQIRAEGTVTRVDVYDDIGSDFFGGGISASDFAGQLKSVRGALDVHINSGGGNVFDGVAIAEAIRAHKGRVTTVIDGLAASIASVIAQSGQERLMAPGSMMMIHDAWGYPDEPNEAGLLKMAATLGKVSDNLAAQYAQRAGGTAAQWREKMRAETWFTADEAVAAGLADGVTRDAAQLPESFDLAAFSSVPGRIAAALRSMPPVIVNAAPQHPPLSVTHSHKGPDGEAEQEHAHDGDASHEGVYDPDGDGDDDSSAEGDTDHDYVLPDGKPGPKALTAGEVRAIIREELRAALRNADKYDTDDRKRMAGNGQAMDDGSYPIADEEDLDNAIHAVGRGGADHDAIRAHIIKRAAALGLSPKIPDNWNSDGSLKQSAGNRSETEFLAYVARELGQLNAGKE
jgi:ATP-dependent protease ClpP protease subunit